MIKWTHVGKLGKSVQGEWADHGKALGRLGWKDQDQVSIGEQEKDSEKFSNSVRGFPCRWSPVEEGPWRSE